MIPRRSGEEIAMIDRACRVVRRVLGELSELAVPGITTGELDAHAEARCFELGAKPAFKGYMGYPSSLCISVNEEVVHGIPGRRRVEDGDLVSIDFGVRLEGYYGDSAITCEVGAVSAKEQRLSRVTQECLHEAIAQVRPGRHVQDIGHAVETHARQAGFSVVREFAGHGIGARLHEEPEIRNYGRRGRGPRIEKGMVFAIEPMITAGKATIRILEDGWTAVTRDGSPAAHWELVAVATEDGPRILGDPERPIEE